MADRHELLIAMLGPQLDAMERVLRHGKAGKYAGQEIHPEPDHHFNHADSHMIRAGALYDCTDDEDGGTGEAHVIHAALRLLMTDHANRRMDAVVNRAGKQ